MLLTVFTPTYNREEKIKDLYNSLLNQSCFNFEWVVVDDGSADRTDLLVKKWIDSTDKFKISYYKQENHGKHSAINKGVELAKGDAFLIVDSDDMLYPTAVEMIHKIISSIEGMENFCGCVGLKIHTNGDVIGQKACSEIVDCTSLQRKKYGIVGDKAEVFYTKILKEYPFPVFDGENFLTEKVVWYRIANDGYKLRWVNEPFIICEYLQEGLTSNPLKFQNNFLGLCETAKEMRRYKCLGIMDRYSALVNACILYRKKGYSTKEFSKMVECNGIIIIMLNIGGRILKRIKHKSSKDHI